MDAFFIGQLNILAIPRNIGTLVKATTHAEPSFKTASVDYASNELRVAALLAEFTRNGTADAVMPDSWAFEL